MIRDFYSNTLKQICWGDLLLFFGLVFGALGTWERVHNQSSVQFVQIQQKEQFFSYSLNEDRNIPLLGEGGEVIMQIKISSKRVWVEESNCALQYCVLRGKIENSGQWLACLPNQVFVRILGSPETETGKFLPDAEAF